MILLTYISAIVLGLAMGSFAGATVWRLRARQLVRDEALYKQLLDRQKNSSSLNADETEALEWLNETKAIRTAELKQLRPLTKAKLHDDRSQCLHCHHTLAWYDLLPLASWLSTKGRCRYCKKSIGRFEPAMEVGAAILFALTLHFVLAGAVSVLVVFWLVVMAMLLILLAYDQKWFLLPDAVMFPLITLALAYATYSVVISNDPLQLAGATVLSIVILSGLYFVLWLVSKGRLVGFGDIKLGLALGLLLMDWKLALMTLFLANLIGTLVVLPGLVTRKLSRKAQVPFGPLLIVGFFIALFWGHAIIEGYNSFSIWLTTMLLML